MSAFASLRVPSQYIARLARMGIKTPTAVQRMGIPVLMPRSPSEVATPLVRHAVLRWPTGSGKTLAYALPLLARLDPRAYGNGTQALIVCPTRELVLQTLHTFKTLVDKGKPNRKGHAIKVQALMGKRNTRLEGELSNAPPDIAVGTPQTVGSLLKTQHLQLGEQPRNRILVLDEIGKRSLLSKAFPSSCAACMIRVLCISFCVVQVRSVKTSAGLI